MLRVYHAPVNRDGTAWGRPVGKGEALKPQGGYGGMYA